MIRIIICDDHPLIHQGLQSIMEEHPRIEVVAAAASAEQLRLLLPQTPADILLLDINLPDGNGIELCAEIKQAYPALRILGISNFSERSIILRMLNSGASGYLLKSSPMEEIETAIIRIYESGVYLGKDVQHCLATFSAQGVEELPPVTPREKEVIRYLSQGLSSVQIAEKMFVSPLTVDTHRRNLLQKFKVSKTVNLLQRAKELGILDM